MTLSTPVPSLSVFFPCYNDSKSIGKLIKQSHVLSSNLQNRGIISSYEILVINDGSNDTSGEVLDKAAASIPNLKIITHPKNLGYGAALRDGFKYSSKELVFYTDGDAQYNIQELTRLIKLMDSNTDFINGIKQSRSDPWFRVVVGSLYNFVVRWCFWLPIIDVDCDFRLIRRKTLRNITLNSTSGSICVELVKKAELSGAKFREVSVSHHPRLYGQSEFFSLSHLLRTFVQLLILWFNLFPQMFMKQSNRG